MTLSLLLTPISILKILLHLPPHAIRYSFFGIFRGSLRHRRLSERWQVVFVRAAQQVTPDLMKPSEVFAESVQFSALKTVFWMLFPAPIESVVHTVEPARVVLRCC